MRLSSFGSALTMAVAMALTAGVATTSAQSPDANADRTQTTARKEATPPTPLATLNGIEAVPMAAQEMESVKGMHIHFTTPSQNEGHPLVDDLTGWHFVNWKENNLGNGQALPISGPGYSGLCGAALLSGALSIPGQNPSTGQGGGC